MRKVREQTPKHKKQMHIPLTKTSKYSDLCQTVEELIGEKPLFELSIMRMVGGQKDFVVDHPDIKSETPLIEGEIRLWTDYWRVAPRKVYSSILTSPTWRDLLCAIQQMLKDNQAGGIFLEQFGPQYLEKGVTNIEIYLGS
jgi:hypothetical protein